MAALNSLITFYARDPGTDAAGQPRQTYTTAAGTAWAEIKHPSGVEQLRGAAEVSLVQASIRVRRRDGIVAGMRAVHSGVVYDIRAVLPDEIDRAYMFLVCQRRPA